MDLEEKDSLADNTKKLQFCIVGMLLIDFPTTSYSSFRDTQIIIKTLPNHIKR